MGKLGNVKITYPKSKITYYCDFVEEEGMKQLTTKPTTTKHKINLSRLTRLPESNKGQFESWRKKAGFLG